MADLRFEAPQINTHSLDDAQIHHQLKLEDVWRGLSADLWQSQDGRTTSKQTGPSALSDKLFEVSPVSNSELSFMQSKGAVQSAGEVLAIKKEVEKAAQAPESALSNAIARDRVVGFGDIHGPLGPQMSFLAEQMPSIREAGVTHMAVEIPQSYQNHVAGWTAADKEFLRQRLKDRGSLIDLIEAAKKSGIDVVAVDEMYGQNGEKLASRDQMMAKNVENILKEPQSKVLFFAGAEHLQNGFRSDSFGPSAVDIMRRHNVAVETFVPQISSSEDSLMHIARQARSALSLSVNDAPSIGRLNNAAGTSYSKWDNVVLFPPHYKMQAVEAELKQFGGDPASQLESAVKNNKVLLLGEMSNAESEQSDSPHRQMIATLMPQLKINGLTDLAIDLPPSYQKSLDQFNQSGIMASPLPDSYDQADFKAVLDAAYKNGIELHAVGLQNESLATMQQIIDGLTDSTAQLATAGTDKKVLLWCREEKIANFDDGAGHNVSVAGNLTGKGLTARSFAALNQDFTDWSLGYVTEILPAPLSFAPGQTRLLKEVPNTMGMEISHFDNVIVYPSPGSEGHT